MNSVWDTDSVPIRATSALMTAPTLCTSGSLHSASDSTSEFRCRSDSETSGVTATACRYAERKEAKFLQPKDFPTGFFVTIASSLIANMPVIGRDMSKPLVKTQCPECGHAGRLPADRIGQRVKCPKCGQRFEARAVNGVSSTPTSRSARPRGGQKNTGRESNRSEWSLEYENHKKLKRRLLFLLVPGTVFFAFLSCLFLLGSLLAGEGPPWDVLGAGLALVLYFLVFIGPFLGNFKSHVKISGLPTGDVQATVSRRVLFSYVYRKWLPTFAPHFEQQRTFKRTEIDNIHVIHSKNLHPLAILLVVGGLICGVLPGIIFWGVLFRNYQNNSIGIVKKGDTTPFLLLVDCAREQSMEVANALHEAIGVPIQMAGNDCVAEDSPA